MGDAALDAGPGRYQWLDFNAPLSGWRADRLAAGLAAAGPERVVDTGCGWGELLLRVLAAAPRARGTGVDVDADLLARARRAATERGLSDRVDFTETEAAAVRAPADAVLCVGASHAFGDTAAALAALRRLVAPGGRLLFGEAIWERPPTAEQAAGLGAAPGDYGSLADLTDLAVRAGFRPLAVETANRDEWEEFESGYLRDWEEWLVGPGSRPEAAERAGQVRARADEHRTGWLRGYRDVLGFAYLTLAVPAA